MGESDVSELRSLYESFNRREVEGLARVMDPEIEIDQTEDLAYAAALLKVLGPRFMILSAGYRGVEEVVGLFQTVWEISEWFEVVPLEFIQMGDLVVVPLLLRAKARYSGHEGEAETAHLWTMAEGRAVRLRVFPTRSDAVAAALRHSRSND
jgi:ketosteroid isomerase-like protein